MDISNAIELAIPFIKEQEGCRLKAYTDPGGRVTIGWGHTGGVQMGEVYSQPQADEQLEYDAKVIAEQIQSIIRVPLTDNQMAALISFTFNLGIGNLQRSGLLKFLNRQNYKEAGNQFLLWNHIGAYVSNDLTKRREAERALFLKDVQ